MNKIKNALWAGILGDALGVPVEFSSREELDENPVIDMREFGDPWFQPKGTWSDDTSMTIATMDSIIFNQDINPLDMMQRFSRWLSKGEYTHDGKGFDCGATTSAAIQRFNERKNNQTLSFGDKGVKANGNGSLMRILPVSLWTYATDNSYLASHVSEMTHAHIRSRFSCVLYTDIVYGLLRGLDVKEATQEASSKWLNANFAFPPEVRKSFQRVLDGSIFDMPRDKIKSGGYCIYSLENALWCTYNSLSVSEALLKAVNLGGDTDTHAAITGGLAGLCLPWDIPAEWMDVLAKKEYLGKIIDDFCELLENRYESFSVTVAI